MCIGLTPLKELPAFVPIFVLNCASEFGPATPVNPEPSPVSAVAARVPVMVTPALDVSNLFVLFQLSSALQPLLNVA